MASKTLTYLDIPVEIRREAAGKARTNIRSLLANPAYSPEQRQKLLAQIEVLSGWEAGTLPIAGLVPPTPPLETGASILGNIPVGFKS